MDFLQGTQCASFACSWASLVHLGNHLHHLFFHMVIHISRLCLVLCNYKERTLSYYVVFGGNSNIIINLVGSLFTSEVS